jgi:cytochrome c-type biogenesis protein CcmH
VNITYWIAVSVLMLIAFAIIIPPLWRKKEIEEADSDQRNITIAQERAKELKQQLQAGSLTQQQFDEEYGELELTLGDDLDIKQKASTSPSQGKWVVPVIALCVPLFSVITYFSLGEPDALIKAEIKQTAQADGQDINAMVMQLAERLKKDPGNAKDWRMLGRSFKYLKQYKLAANSFKKAYDLLGDEPALMLQYADSLVMANGGVFTGKPAELIFKALEKLPNDETGLWLAGMAKAEQKDFSQAVTYWGRLLAGLPAGSDSAKQVQSLIAQVKMQSSGVTPVENTATSRAKVESAVSINVQVSVASELKAKTSQGDTVFIYAKALTGRPMPLAIVRKKVSDLPLTITLDDAMAMMPTMKLSNFKAVKVMARISKSGTAMQQKGDFIGELELSALTENQSVVIVINKEI